jgi:hypothetical protein
MNGIFGDKDQVPAANNAIHTKRDYMNKQRMFFSNVLNCILDAQTKGRRGSFFFFTFAIYR